MLLLWLIQNILLAYVYVRHYRTILHGQKHLAYWKGFLLLNYLGDSENLLVYGSDSISSSFNNKAKEKKPHTYIEE